MNAITKEFTDAVEKQLSALKADVAEAVLETKTLNGHLFHLEQKVADRPYGIGTPVDQSWGEQFAAADELKEFVDNRRRPGRLRMEIKSTILSGSTSAGALTVPHRDTTVITPQRALSVRSLLPVVPITTGSIEYPKQTVRTNNADVVAEGQVKPESGYAFAMQTLTPKVIAHWVPAARQILEDAPQLAGIIDTELRYGLALKEDAELLYGSGTGEHLLGMVTQATPYAAPFAPAGGTTMLDQVALAILQTTLADYNPTGIIMHPSDWMRIRLLKDADGKYLLGDPGANVAPLLFGLPVVATTSMAIDKFLVGDFQQAATLYDRWTPRVEVSTEHADFFTRNLVAILAEERIGLAVKQALALTYGDFGNVA